MTLPEIDRVLVVGAGIGGLAAASTLAGFARRVTIIDRDLLPDAPIVRRGIPQGHHLHNLLSRAQRELERAVPGALSGLRAAGCGDASVADETHVYELGRPMPERALGLRLMSGPRPAIEHAVRTIVLRNPSVEIVSGASAGALEVNRDGQVTGLRVIAGSTSRTWPCDLVIDARGSGPPTADWLRDLGRPMPPTLTRQQSRWYVSSILQRAEDQVGDPSFWLAFPTAPDTRGALISPLDSHHWLVSVSGGPGDSAPRTYPEMLTYLCGLRDHRPFATLIQAGTGSPPRRFRRQVATWRRYDQLDDPVTGYLPLGDAMATLDPLYGQGMSVAAWQATILGDLVGTHGGHDLGTLTQNYLAGAAQAVAAAWNVGMLVDGWDHPAADTPEPAPVRQRRLGRLIAEHPDLHRSYVRMWHLLDPATDLGHLVERYKAPRTLTGVA